MYTASGGYYYDSTSFNRKKPNNNRFTLRKLPMIKLIFLLTLFILSLVFGTVINVYATNDVGQQEHIQLTSTYEVHIVDAGQSLWGIAKQHAPASMDIRDYVNKMKTLNQLHTNNLFEGQRLLLPSL